MSRTSFSFTVQHRQLSSCLTIRPRDAGLTGNFRIDSVKFRWTHFLDAVLLESFGGPTLNFRAMSQLRVPCSCNASR